MTVGIRTLLFALILLVGKNVHSATQSGDELARGNLLYTTHCVSCHSLEIHWREKKLVRNWNDLKMQVSRWQKNAGLGWGKEDVEQVSSYLNVTFYHFPDLDNIGIGPKRNEKQSRLE